MASRGRKALPRPLSRAPAGRLRRRRPSASSGTSPALPFGGSFRSGPFCRGIRREFMRGNCLYPLRATLATLGLIGAALPVCTPLPAKAGSYESCVGFCAIGSYANSPTCIARKAQCASSPSTPNASSGSGNYGAIAFSRRSHAYGVDSNSQTQERADRLARNGCLSVTKNAGDCAVEVRFSSTCAALAYSPSGVVKTGKNRSATVARADAVIACERETGQRCKLVTSECSP
ncbi:protein of unknown function [Rhizobiales bacterium GAS113]|nr:protein of unknown function [Rhizobiales bacterium GAS113]